MPRAIFNGTVIAESNRTEHVEGNHYFPPASLRREHLTPTAHATVCPWKGTATYFDVTVDGSTAANAAWSYPQPTAAAVHIKDHVAFDPSITVEA